MLRYIAWLAKQDHPVPTILPTLDGKDALGLQLAPSESTTTAPDATEQGRRRSLGSAPSSSSSSSASSPPPSTSSLSLSPVSSNEEALAEEDTDDDAISNLSTPGPGTQFPPSSNETGAQSRSSSVSTDRTLVDPELGREVLGKGKTHENFLGQSISIPELYYRCHNLSHYPQAPPLVRRFLLRFLSHFFNPTTSPNLEKDPSFILSLSDDFDASTLEGWLKVQYKCTTDRFEQYLGRRKDGGGREMFRDRDDAVRWCKQSAVVKYVDGSWLQSTFQSTTGLEVDASGETYTPRAARRASRVSWQVLSEELGDGNLDKEHCKIFENLIDNIALPPGTRTGSSKDTGTGAVGGGSRYKRTPKADEHEFLRWNASLGESGAIENAQPFVAAMLQLAMSISPNEFLPEILGFNLSYEGLPLHLMITSHELKELKIDPYYFILHISIDNCDSGHSAMALLAVIDFLRDAQEKQGKAAANRLWRRVQAGYTLADSVRTTPKTYKELEQEKDEQIVSGPNRPLKEPLFWKEGVPLAKEDLRPTQLKTRHEKEQAMLRIFRNKATGAKGLHSSCMGRVGGRRIGEWLDPDVLADPEQARQFIEGLAHSPVWIKKGKDYESSRLIREFEWGGRMFGAFTNSEVTALKEWVASLLTDEEADLDHTLEAQKDLDNRLSQPYLDFIEGKQPSDPQASTPSATPSCRLSYFHKAIQPVDFSDYLRGVSTFSGWVQAAPHVYGTVIEHPHGIRGIFQRSSGDFLRKLVPAPVKPIPRFGPRDFIHDVILDARRPAFSSQAVIKALLPALFVSAGACLEWMPAASPVKLASPLGMMIVKLQRTLYGFAAKDAEEEDEGCAGTDDVRQAKDGIWELGVQLAGGDGNITLASFRDAGDRALALPALALLLNSQPTLHLPLLLGIQLGLNIMVQEPLCKNTTTTPDLTMPVEWKERLSELVVQSRYWLVRAIELGGSRNPSDPPELRNDGHGQYEYSPTRGWEGDGDWNENVLLGLKFVEKCLEGLV